MRKPPPALSGPSVSVLVGGPRVGCCPQSTKPVASGPCLRGQVRELAAPEQTQPRVNRLPSPHSSDVRSFSCGISQACQAPAMLSDNGDTVVERDKGSSFTEPPSMGGQKTEQETSGGERTEQEGREVRLCGEEQRSCRADLSEAWEIPGREST